MSDIAGHFDGFRDGRIFGWATRASAPGQPVDIECFVDGGLWLRGVADQFRGDLALAGAPSTRCGFEFSAEGISGWVSIFARTPEGLVEVEPGRVFIESPPRLPNLPMAFRSAA